MTGVLDHGHVQLVLHAGGDLSVVNAARVSFGKQVTELSFADKALIGYLMREKHGSPFEHNLFTFRVKAPIFIAREHQRHRIGSFNEISGRYAELPEEFYIPETSDVRRRVGKPGHYQYEPVEDYQAYEFGCWFDSVSADAHHAYREALSQGIAPELARLVLPVNTYTEYLWSVNARSLMNFLSLRLAPNAQLEIRRYAEAIEDIFEQEMPCTFQHFTLNNRQAP
jgi:thymidylate synthase (FAD)